MVGLLEHVAVYWVVGFELEAEDKDHEALENLQSHLTALGDVEVVDQYFESPADEVSENLLGEIGEEVVESGRFGQTQKGTAFVESLEEL